MNKVLLCFCSQSGRPFIFCPAARSFAYTFFLTFRTEFLPYLDESFKEVLKLVQVGHLKTQIGAYLCFCTVQ